MLVFVCSLTVDLDRSDQRVIATDVSYLYIFTFVFYNR